MKILRYMIYVSGLMFFAYCMGDIQGQIVAFSKVTYCFKSGYWEDDFFKEVRE